MLPHKNFVIYLIFISLTRNICYAMLNDKNKEKIAMNNILCRLKESIIQFNVTFSSRLPETQRI